MTLLKAYDCHGDKKIGIFGFDPVDIRNLLLSKAGKFTERGKDEMSYLFLFCESEDDLLKKIKRLMPNAVLVE